MSAGSTSKERGVLVIVLPLASVTATLMEFVLAVVGMHVMVALFAVAHPAGRPTQAYVL
jgi:hypothetical protein